MQVTSSFQQTTNPSGKRIFLEQLKVDVQDNTPSSPTYFNITEILDTLTSGKNCIAINGSDNLLAGSQILVEALDTNGNALYTEVARAPSQYRDGVAVLVSIWVYSTTPLGVGQINIVGTLSDNRRVRWTRIWPINPILQNQTRTRFYNTPTFEVVPAVDRTLYFSGSYVITSSGSVNGSAVVPVVNSNFYNFDSLRNKVDYRLSWIGGSKFSSYMDGQPIVISNIIATDGSTFIYNGFVDSVINDTSLTLQAPIFSPITPTIKNVYNFSSASYLISCLNPPTASLSQEFNGIAVTYDRSIAQIKISNLDTFAGNVYRFRIYRKSLNSSFDSECISDEVLNSREEFIDSYYPDRFRDKIGYFLSQEHITGTTGLDKGYWRVEGTYSSQVSLQYNSTYIIDGMYISGSNVSPNPNLEKRVIVHSYNNSSLLGTGDTSSLEVNPIVLEANVQYILSFNMVGFKDVLPNEAGQIDFYLVDEINGSTQDQSVSPNFDGYGIKIGSVSFQSGLDYQNFQTQTFGFSLNKPANGQLHIVPYFGDYIISEVSIKAYQDFSFSPSVANINVPFNVDVANEAFQITAELFDVNCAQIPTPNLTTIQSFDPEGVTVYNRQDSQVPAAVSVLALNANTASTATTADNAIYAEFADQAGTSSLSVIAYTSINSNYATTAGNSATATTAITANSSITATSASYAAFATNAGYVKFSSLWSDFNLLNLGQFYFWVSGSSLRASTGRPTSESDGTEFITTDQYTGSLH
jgi:hypothetical protein